MPKQIIRVLESMVKHGANTSNDVAAITGIRIAICSAVMSELQKMGYVTKTERLIVHLSEGAPRRSGRRYSVWEVTSSGRLVVE